MQTVKWGIIGCGDVCEVKSGPGFYKADHSELVIVMRRDAEKAADFAKRHGVSQSTSNAGEVIHHPRRQRRVHRHTALLALRIRPASRRSGANPVTLKNPWP